MDGTDSHCKFRQTKGWLNIMFLKAKFRGIPLYTLAQSGLCPQVTLLAKLWETAQVGNYDPIQRAKRNIGNELILWGLLALGLFLSKWRVAGSEIIGASFFAAGLVLSLSYIAMQPWEFTKALSQLDKCLKRECAYGIARLPNTDVAIVFERFLRDKMEQAAYHVLFHKESEGRESYQAKDWLAFMTDLGNIAQEFGHDLGGWNPYFEKAAERLDLERQKKKDSLPDHASIKA